MQTVLMVAHLIIAVLLVGIILLQRTSEDSLGGLAGGSGGFGGIMSVRSSATFFSRITMILATLFIINCLVLANLSLRQSSQSIVSKITIEQSLSEKEQQGKQDHGGTPIPMAQ